MSSAYLAGNASASSSSLHKKSTGDLSKISKIFLIVVVVEAMVILALTLSRVLYHSVFDIHTEEALLLCIETIFMVYFAFNGVINESQFELISFNLVTIIVFIYTTYNKITYHCADQKFLPREVCDGLLWARFACVCIFTPLNCILGWKTYKSFGWKVYRKIGADLRLQAMYRTYQIFSALLKVDLLFGFTLVLGIGLFQIGSRLDLYMGLAMLILTILLVLIGAYAVRHEVRFVMYIFWVVCLFEPAYLIWKIIDARNNPDSFSGHDQTDFAMPAIIFAAAAITVRFTLFVLTIFVFKNFNKGLRRVFAQEEASGEVGPLLR
eukprot:TRINITY_DN7174_c0_g1_i1.p1 TRINITY_DN7174_c0_g1~~TRINITY_DN7174_c0_g1_i1.p1  ORF type:complete len:323 (-),score=47.01 TRINITY_DN7174_c0_g1_i1:83-1051(-)